MDLYTRVILRARVILRVLVGAFALNSTVFAATYPPQRVVYDVDSGARTKWDVTLKNIHNHLEAVGPSHISLIVVVHGRAVRLFQQTHIDHKLNHRLETLLALGIRIRLSHDALTERGLRPDEMADRGQWVLVKSGAAEIVRLERRGYIYIKP
ncbi:MAG: DsrE family protein [Acidiferrobacteraceae bacterium]